MLEKVMEVLQTVNYRWIDDESFIYTPDEVLEKREGNCWEQVELTRKIFKDYGITVDSYYASLSDDSGKFQTHTFIVYKKDNSFLWIEHSWDRYSGIHEYVSLNELLKDVKAKLVDDFNGTGDVYAFVYQYDGLPKPMKAPEFLDYCSKQKLIKLNDPVYVYYFANKDEDMSLGILSLKYLYDNQMYDLFDKSVNIYKSSVTGNFHIPKYEGRDDDSLTREEILDGLSRYKGEYGSSYIYFFKYSDKDELIKHAKRLLNVNDIYRININDEEVQLHIKDIVYDCSDINSTDILNSNLVAISFINDYCPIKFLEKL